MATLAVSVGRHTVKVCFRVVMERRRNMYGGWEDYINGWWTMMEILIKEVVLQKNVLIMWFGIWGLRGSSPRASKDWKKQGPLNTNSTRNIARSVGAFFSATNLFHPVFCFSMSAIS
ncbi:hypothetical protein GOP47_0004354 [Adiantum capillus-veneris]|uniref:Uncharacterized protein n=1 Tax=Adiantum capillus-veneris TaxID=13818 RepID=A0A9D4V8I4_ADICA|nr:hypothetical protein GOP47_0004354 [Adiantum capillus-veneris]